DAFWYLQEATSRADGVVFEPTPGYDLEPWTSIGRGWFALFGAGLASACALGAAIGVATVAATFLFARPLGERPAAVAGVLLAVGAVALAGIVAWLDPLNVATLTRHRLAMYAAYEDVSDLAARALEVGCRPVLPSLDAISNGPGAARLSPALAILAILAIPL